jgi:uncharacterized protein YbbC (DUF1343 family)
MAVQNGVDIFLKKVSAYSGKRFGLVTNHAATTATYRPSREALLDEGFQIVRLFSPEHGLDTIGEDGKYMRNGIDELTGLPVISLYGDNLRPSLVEMEDLDAILFDLPDIGCRFYTYLWSLTHVMEACWQYQKPLIILDRPNPVSGNFDLAEGPMLDETSCSSFIGRWNIPLRHGCTLGELASYWKVEKMPTLQLEVSRNEGWDRSFFQQGGPPSFVPTSPAMVSQEAALLYPGLGLLEATNMSEGRGTATPFRIAGAPWFKTKKLVQTFNMLALPGLVLRSITFTPLSGKYRDELCQGVMFHVTDRTLFKPVFTALLFIKLVRDMHADNFQWASYPTHVNPTGENHLNLLLGIPNVSKLFDKSWEAFNEQIPSLLHVEAWSEKIRPYLLY